ncbi:MAG: hypothetical protein SCG82_01940 [Candidatus Nitrotoga sp.]|jgi:hypothetical protein|nr:hypothetical protein [Candidatus Nitrotoga sp.]MDW7604841.1 hypothetical protein [Candidatus Nitrotoga sp.]MDW7612796.1 hypothetical protein [Candidatus Nitrotoga sp.]MDW7625431.1 hypothetical protein [Candidatus Nitrotoga sp.]
MFTNINNLFLRVPIRYFGYLSLLLWGAATLFLLRPDSYGLDEGAAKALLLVWSMADQVATSAVTFNMPDLRALLFLPVAFLWTGKVFAAKVFTALTVALAIWLFYLWSRRTAGAESALVASGLLIISPLVLEQIDALSPGIYLLPAFALGAWLNTEYRTNPRPGGGWFFSQLLVSAVSASLHPIGLAYPLALLWSWHKEPLDRKQQQYFFIGVSFVCLFALFVTGGWSELEWFQNPIKALSIALLGSSLGNEATTLSWVAGGAMLAGLILVISKQFHNLWSSFTGRTLLVGVMLGVFAGDSAWGFIALSLMLYLGVPLLLRPAQPITGGGPVRQRGIALLLIVILSTVFMRMDKAHYEVQQSGLLSEEDRLIHSLVREVEGTRKVAEASKDRRASVYFRIASQWPSRTMIACKCDTLPLPPPARDPAAQLTMLRSITHLLFNPRQAKNLGLARNLSVLGGDTVETIALQSGGALLHFKGVLAPANLTPTK